MVSQISEQLFAIVPAAGIGQRMRTAEGDPPKQYLLLGGKTVIEHSISALMTVVAAKNIMVCVAQDDQQWSAVASNIDLELRSTLGGATRAQSVYNGLLALADSAQADDWVLVHDAARPCLTQAALTQLVSQVSDDPVGGILAIPAKDTLKLSDSSTNTNARIVETIDREKIWQAQTPQMFRYGLLLSALQHALDNNEAITDEASALELIGHQAKLIEGDARNLKITTIDDLSLAEFLLQNAQS